MKRRNRPVSIRKLPERFDGAHRKSFYQEIESCINVDRPLVVLDCSMLSVLDRPALQALLCCLEEAMKRNGDVRLAALRPESRAILHSTGLDSLFEVFDSIGEAVESFHMPHFSFTPLEQFVSSDSNVESNAA